MFILEDGGLSSERIGGEEERERGGTGGKGISSGQLCGSNPGNPLNPSEESQSLKKQSESQLSSVASTTEIDFIASKILIKSWSLLLLSLFLKIRKSDWRIYSFKGSVLEMHHKNELFTQRR